MGAMSRLGREPEPERVIETSWRSLCQGGGSYGRTLGYLLTLKLQTLLFARALPATSLVPVVTVAT
jgi:hypothetical protein